MPARAGIADAGVGSTRSATLNSHDALRATIDDAYEARAQLNPRSTPAALRAAIEQCIDLLNEGQLRVAQPEGGAWRVNQWLKKAVLLSFRINENASMPRGRPEFLRQGAAEIQRLERGSLCRRGRTRGAPGDRAARRLIGANVVLMPSYVNVGAYVDSGTMVDTWATVGSCAQIGKNVHLSGGVGIGGVLEPLASRVRPSSKTTASSARAQKSSRAW